MELPDQRSIIESAIDDPEDVPIFDADEQGVIIITYPDITVRRVEQAKLPIARQPVVACPVDGRQVLAIDPSTIVPAMWPDIALQAVAVGRHHVAIIRLRVEAATIGLPLRWVVTGLVSAPVVALVLLDMLLLLNLPLIRPLLRLPLLLILLVSVPVVLVGQCG